jgi:hypothetical protein
MLSRFAAPMFALAVVCCAAGSARADVCRQRLPDGRVILTLPPPGVPCVGTHPLPMQRTHVAPSVVPSAQPSMRFTTGEIGPFTTGRLGPVTTFSNTVPARGLGHR